MSGRPVESKSGSRIYLLLISLDTLKIQDSSTAYHLMRQSNELWQTSPRELSCTSVPIWLLGYSKIYHDRVTAAHRPRARVVERHWVKWPEKAQPEAATALTRRDPDQNREYPGSKRPNHTDSIETSFPEQPLRRHSTIQYVEYMLRILAVDCIAMRIDLVPLNISISLILFNLSRQLSPIFNIRARGLTSWGIFGLTRDLRSTLSTKLIIGHL